MLQTPGQNSEQCDPHSEGEWTDTGHNENCQPGIQYDDVVEGGEHIEETDACSNILVATDYLAQLFEEEGDDLYLVLMKYNMKHDRAEELYNSGIYSEYATTISQRAWELEVLHEQKGDQP